jgi:hypothetical protein
MCRPRSTSSGQALPVGPISQEKPRSQNRDLGHPLEVWRLQLDFRQRDLRFSGPFLENDFRQSVFKLCPDNGLVFLNFVLNRIESEWPRGRERLVNGPAALYNLESKGIKGGHFSASGG